MTLTKLLSISWNFEPKVILGCVVLCCAYFASIWKTTNGQFTNSERAKAIWFVLGIVTVLLALVSPLDRIGEDYLFSAHMLQHILLNSIAPLLFVIGTPKSLIEGLIKNPIIDLFEKVLGNPILTLILANATFYLWHLPTLYNLTLENQTVHIFEHMLLIVTGTMLWWPVFKPIERGRLSYQYAIIYLTIAAMLSTLLGIMFTIAETPFYAAYAHPEDTMGALNMIRSEWGLDQIADQKLGGAIMWEPMGAVYLLAMMKVVADWFKSESEGSSPSATDNTTENATENATAIVTEKGTKYVESK